MFHSTQKYILVHLPIYHILLVIAYLFILTSCEGGSSNSTPTTTMFMENINGIIVPPEPDKEKNNATLAGIDSNSNGVRDDVERRIAKKSSSASLFDVTIEIAKKYQKILVDPTLTKAQLKQEFIKIDCYILKNKTMVYDQTEISKIISNSIERKKAYVDIAIKTGGYIVDPDTDCK